MVAIQLLCDLIQNGRSANYVTKNSAPRNVYFEKLKQNNYKNSYIENLFRGSGSYINVENNYFDCLIADEAHRLNAKSGIFQNLGENQIKEIIHASKVSVFFIDENQIVTTADIGSIELINKYAKEELADVMNYCLQMALVLKLDPIEIINKKIDKNEKKYPVEKAKGVSTKYNKL